MALCCVPYLKSQVICIKNDISLRFSIETRTYMYVNVKGSVGRILIQRSQYSLSSSDTQQDHKPCRLTFRPSRAPESRGTLPSFMRLLSKIRPMRRSPSLDGCHVTRCYKVRATTHLLFNDSSTPIWWKQTTVNTDREGVGEVGSHRGRKVHTNGADLSRASN